MTPSRDSEPLEYPRCVLCGYHDDMHGQAPAAELPDGCPAHEQCIETADQERIDDHAA